MKQSKGHLIIEITELSERLLNLTKFMQTNEFADLSKTEKIIITRQSEYMELYANILHERIHAF